MITNNRNRGHDPYDGHLPRNTLVTKPSLISNKPNSGNNIDDHRLKNKKTFRGNAIMTGIPKIGDEGGKQIGDSEIREPSPKVGSETALKE